jgi:multiple sugar transport system substrate-binding protein
MGAGAGGVATALTGCASGGALGGPAPAPSETQGIVVWSTRANADENRWQQDFIVPKMKDKFPKLNLSLEVGSADDWDDKLIASYAAGSPPDIHHGWDGIIFLLYVQGKALELTPYIKRDKVDMSPYGGLQNSPEMCRSGRQYQMPIDAGLGFMLFYNAAMLQQAGLPLPPTSWQDKTWTWDVALDMMRKTTKNYGDPNAVYGLFGIGADPQFQIFSNVWGSDPWPKELYSQGIAQTSNWTSPPVVQALQFIQDLALKHRVMPDQNTKALAFNMGGTAMWLMGVRGAVGQLNNVTFPWGIAPMPRQVTNNTAAFYNGIMANKGGKYPDAAWQTIKYVTSKEANLDRIAAALAPPTRLDAFDPWLDAVLPKTVFKNKAQLKEVTTGFLSAYQNSWSHCAVESTKLAVPINDLKVSLLGGKGTAATLLADTKTKVEAQLRTTYEAYRNSPLAKDTLCT